MKLSARFVGLGIPAIKDKTDFPQFQKQIKHNFKQYSLLYDIEIANEDNGSIEFRTLNCPFTSALKEYGVPQLCKFACAGDFLMQKKISINGNSKEPILMGQTGNVVIILILHWLDKARIG